jgi:hypothetical protein
MKRHKSRLPIITKLNIQRRHMRRKRDSRPHPAQTRRIIQRRRLLHRELAPDLQIPHVRKIRLIPQRKAIRVPIIPALIRRTLIKKPMEIQLLPRVILMHIRARPRHLIRAVLDTEYTPRRRLLANADAIPQSPAHEPSRTGVRNRLCLPGHVERFDLAVPGLDVPSTGVEVRRAAETDEEQAWEFLAHEKCPGRVPAGCVRHPGDERGGGAEGGACGVVGVGEDGFLGRGIQGTAVC